MPFYLAWIYSNFSRWNFKFFSISDLSYGTNQDFMPFIHAQFFVARYPQKLHSGLLYTIAQKSVKRTYIRYFFNAAILQERPLYIGIGASTVATVKKLTGS